MLVAVRCYEQCWRSFLRKMWDKKYSSEFGSRILKLIDYIVTVITVYGDIVMKCFSALLALPFCVCSFSLQADPPPKPPKPDPCASELKIILDSLEAEGGWRLPIPGPDWYGEDGGWLRWAELEPGHHKDKKNEDACQAHCTYYGEYYPEWSR